MENLPELPLWVTWENVLIAAGILETTLGAVPNTWLKYRSFLLRVIAAVVRFIDES